MAELARTTDEIEAEILEALDHPNKYPGMTYSQGVDNALRWVTGETDDKPLTDE